MDTQFEDLHLNPDMFVLTLCFPFNYALCFRIIATPGRLLHIVIEMNLKLDKIAFVVFDEADRLFEMGFVDQLLDVLARLPENRQTALFSATLPKMLVDFARAGLNEPVLGINCSNAN